MKATNLRINYSVLVKIILLLSLTGCANFGSPIKTDDLNSIKVGTSTRDDVVKLLGKPQATEDNEIVYYNLALKAEKGTMYMQESHIELGSNDIVTKTFHTDIIRGEGLRETRALKNNLSSLEIGATDVDSVMQRLYPSHHLAYYENGLLIYKQLVYRTSEPWNKTLSELSYLKAKSNEEGESYSLFFSPDGILTKPIVD